MLTEKDRAFIADIVGSPQVADAVTRACSIVDAWCASVTGQNVPAKDMDAAMTDALYLGASNGYFAAFGAMFRPMMQATVAKVRAARSAGLMIDPAAEFLGSILPAVAATLDSVGPRSFAEIAERTQAHMRNR